MYSESLNKRESFFEQWRTVNTIPTLFARCEKPAHCGFHEHQKLRISFLVKGAVEEVNDRNQKVDTRDISLVYTPPGMTHAHRILSPTVTHLCADFDLDYLKAAGCENLINQPAVFKSGPVITTMLRIQREIVATDTASDLILQGLFLQLLGEMNRSRIVKAPFDAPSWLRRATTLLRERALENVSIEEIAKEVGVDPSHLARVFRSYLNETPGDFLRKQRLAWAAREIARSDKPLHQIAAESGYSDQSHFNKHFKSHMGVAPGEFRRSVRFISLG
jgi:AraC-like DNA-binding protein